MSHSDFWENWARVEPADSAWRDDEWTAWLEARSTEREERKRDYAGWPLGNVDEVRPMRDSRAA